MKVALALAFALALGACQAPAASARPGEIEHVVLIWLKDDAPPDLAERIVATAHGFVGPIPGLLGVAVGPPVASERAVVDDSFDLGLVMRFTHEQALDDYLVNPLHVAAVEELLTPNASNVVIYDVRARGS